MFKAIAFDLDDTLMDTSGILVPWASTDAFNILIQAGLKLNLHDCEIKRLEIIKTFSHREVFLHLAQHFGSSHTVDAVPDAIKAFYEPQLPAHLPLLPGALKNIQFLKEKYPLFLVTAGVDHVQRQKARALGIAQDFEKIYVTNSLLKEKKAKTFLEIIKNKNIHSAELLCIGNSLQSEIVDALKIGATACYFEFGEDRGYVSQLDSEKPHFHIRHHDELILACKL